MPTDHDPHLAARAAELRRYCQDMPADDAIDHLCLRVASREAGIERLSNMLHDARAEMAARNRALAQVDRMRGELGRLRAEVQRMEPVYLAALNWRLAREAADGDGTRDVQDRYDAAVHRLVEACDRVAGEVSGRG